LSMPEIFRITIYWDMNTAAPHNPYFGKNS